MGETPQELEVLLRRIEVGRYFENPREPYTVERFSAIARDFLNGAEVYRDWRFLNVALKLADALRACDHPSVAELQVIEDRCLATLRRDSGVSE